MVITVIAVVKAMSVMLAILVRIGFHVPAGIERKLRRPIALRKKWLLEA